MSKGVKMEGFADIEKILDALPKALGPKVVQDSIRDGVKPLIKQAKANAPRRPGSKGGSLKKSIGVIKGGKTQEGTVVVGPRRGKGKTTDGWHAHLVEYGVSPRIVKKPTKGHYKKGTVLGAMPAKPFMRPAWDTTNGLVRQKIAKNLSEVLKSNFKGVFK
jgi:HK97 gp10 family phage protein